MSEDASQQGDLEARVVAAIETARTEQQRWQAAVDDATDEAQQIAASTHLAASSAVRAVLEHGHAFPRAQLVTEVRAVLGYARTGAALDEAITRALDELLAAGELGEAAAGIRSRARPALPSERSPATPPRTPPPTDR